MREIIIPADDEKLCKFTSIDKIPGLSHKQKIVGGLIQEVPHTFEVENVLIGDGTNERVTIEEMWCNEEGLIMGLPFNARATQLWLRILGSAYAFAYQPRLFGDVVLYVR